MKVIFKNPDHKAQCADLLKRMQSHDCYHQAAAYLLALNDTCRAHVKEIFDFEADVIKPEALCKPWQTGTSMKTCRLLFNLWNGYDSEGEQIEDEKHSANYTPENLFCNSDMVYMLEAVKIRYSIYYTAELDRRDYAEEIACSAKDGASDD